MSRAGRRGMAVRTTSESQICMTSGIWNIWKPNNLVIRQKTWLFCKHCFFQGFRCWRYIYIYIYIYMLRFYRAFFLAFHLPHFWDCIWLFWYSLWHSIWYSIWHSVWDFIWHTAWHSIWHFLWGSMWHTFWHPIWHSCGSVCFQMHVSQCDWTCKHWLYLVVPLATVKISGPWLTCALWAGLSMVSRAYKSTITRMNVIYPCLVR